LNRYANNSPEAIARLVALFMVTDGHMDERELDTLEKLHVYELIGLPRKRFVTILTELCDAFADAEREDGSIALLDKERVDDYLSLVTDRTKRLLTCALALDVCKSDGSIGDAEMALLRYMMGSWRISLDDLEAELIRR